MPLTLKNFNRKLSPISNLTATAGNGQITLTWTDPSDTSTSMWASTKLVRKTGSAPSSSTDGTLVITETTRNQYSSSGYADTGLTNGTTYYYKAFVVDSGGNEIASNSVSETPSKPVHSDMQGPSPDGFHVPLDSEWTAVKTVWTTLGGGSDDGTNFGIALKMPFAGDRNSSSATIQSQGSRGYYYSSSGYDTTNRAYYLLSMSGYVDLSNSLGRAYGFSVRCFKDSPVIPTSSWTKLYGTSIEAGGIFWSSSLGLISLSSNGTTWITMADKNLGATTVWNNGDTLSEANCGKYYQWGNNYGFAWTGSITTSSTQVDASNYGPGNYYESSTYITGNSDWSSSTNDNLRGGVTQGTWTELKTYEQIIAMSLNNALAELNSDVSGYYNKFRGVNFVGQGYLGDPSITKIWNWFSQSYIDEIDMMSVEYDVIRYNQYASPAVFVKQSG